MSGTNGTLWRWLCGDTTARDRRNLARLMWLLAAWAVVFVGGSMLLRRDIVPAGPLSWGLAAVTLGLALSAVLAYGRFLRDADGLQRRIHLEALALGFGGGWIAVAGYRLFELLGAPPADRGTVILVMAVLYAVGLARGRWRYS